MFQQLQRQTSDTPQWDNMLSVKGPPQCDLLFNVSSKSGFTTYCCLSTWDKSIVASTISWNLRKSINSSWKSFVRVQKRSYLEEQENIKTNFRLTLGFVAMGIYLERICEDLHQQQPVISVVLFQGVQQVTQLCDGLVNSIHVLQQHVRGEVSLKTIYRINE